MRVVVGAGDSVTVEMRVKISVAKGVGVLNMSEKLGPYMIGAAPIQRAAAMLCIPRTL